MAYDDLLEEEGLQSDYMIVLNPARVVTGFTLFDGSTYSVGFDFGEVRTLTQDGASLVLASSTSLSSGEFFYDVDASVLYVRMSDDSNPSTKTVVGFYEITIGTKDQHFHRVPTDSTTRDVYYEPFVQNSPVISASQQDNFFGLLPAEITQIQLNNAEHFFEKHIYDGSFKNKVIDIYHTIKDRTDREIKVENTKKIFSGLMGDVGYSQQRLTIQVLDRVNQFKEEFRNADTSFWKASDFADLDTSFEGRAIRYVYGRVEGFIPVNLDVTPEDETPDQTTNRIWGVRADKTNDNEISQLTTTGSTTTVLEFVAAPQFGVGDSIKVAAQRTFVTEVSATSMTVAPAVAAPASGVAVTRATVSRVVILQGEDKFIAEWDRDYTMKTDLTNDVLGIEFNSSAESNLSMPDFIQPGDQIICTVYGKENNVTLGGSPFGTDDATTGNLTAAPVILFDLLKNFLGIPESEINTSSFTDLLVDTTEGLSFAIPDRAQSDFPIFRDLFGRITETVLIRWHLDNDNTWTVQIVEPLDAATSELRDDEIMKQRFNYKFDYSDLVSDIVVEYRFQELQEEVNKLESITKQVTASSDLAKWLHEVNATKTVTSLHLKEADARNLADHMAFIFGDRFGRLTLSTKNRFFDKMINDVIDIQRDRLPGFEFESGTVRSRDLITIETDRSLREIKLVLDDQKGIEDNSGEW